MIDTLLLIQSYSHPSFWYAQIINFRRCCVSSSSHFYVTSFTSSSNAKEISIDVPLGHALSVCQNKLPSKGRDTAILQSSLENVNKSSSPFSFRHPSIFSRYCVSPSKTAFLSSSPLCFCFCSLHNTTLSLNCQAMRLTMTFAYNGPHSIKLTLPLLLLAHRGRKLTLNNIFTMKKWQNKMKNTKRN